MNMKSQSRHQPYGLLHSKKGELLKLISVGEKMAELKRKKNCALTDMHV